jgi:hypothetical protein
VQRLQQSVTDLRVKNRLLEDENQSLRASQTEAAIPPSTVQTAKVTQLFEDFDSFFAAQGNDISALLTARDRLSTLCFTALALCSKQESLLQQFNSSLQALFNFISRGGETAASVLRSFDSIGIDCTHELELIARQAHIREFCSTGCDSVSDGEVLSVLEELARIPADRATLKKLTDFVRSQISEKRELSVKIENREADLSKIQKEIGQISDLLQIRQSKRPFPQAVARRFAALQRSAKEGAASRALLREVVNVVVHFASAFADDLNVRCCLGRVSRWLANPQAIDIAQEISFLLGLWTAGVPVEDDGRQQFIRERMHGRLPLNGTWTEVCEALIARARGP